MMRNKTSSALQKTYDDCYLICSTAVYFEGQGNEAEALRSWRSALDQIYYHNAYRVPANYLPKTETEKALQESLRAMELQCKERVDLLEALKRSRQEQSSSDDASGVPSTSGNSNGKLTKTPVRTPRQSSESDNAGKGFIGDGTIPAATYPDLSRPVPPLPQRPSYLTKNSSERAVVGRKTSASSLSTLSVPPISPGPSTSLAPPPRDPSRSSSPEKGRSMLMTLRSGKGDRKSASRTGRAGGQTRVEVPSKAATLAWNSVSKTGRDRLGRSLAADAGSSSTTLDTGRKNSFGGSLPERPSSSHLDVHYDTHTRTLVNDNSGASNAVDLLSGTDEISTPLGHNSNNPFLQPEFVERDATIRSARSSGYNDLLELDSPLPMSDSETSKALHKPTPPPVPKHRLTKLEPVGYPTYFKEYPETSAKKVTTTSQSALPVRQRSPVKGQTRSEEKPPRITRRPIANSSSPRKGKSLERSPARRTPRSEASKHRGGDTSSQSFDEDSNNSDDHERNINRRTRKQKQKQKEEPILADPATPDSDESDGEASKATETEWQKKVTHLMKHLPRGIDENAAKQILNEIVVKGDEVHWDDVAGLEVAKKTLKEAVVYPFLRPDLFVGLREPARGMLLFGPPGTGKTMLARAVATESRSTFFSISASSLTSKYLGESEKLVRALFALAKALAPSIIFVDEIDSLLSARSGSSEHEATRRLKTEFLIQWSDLQRAAAGREQSEKEKERGDASRVLVLAATNLPWEIDEAARRRFVRRQYIPLPEVETRAAQLRTLLGHQKHNLSEEDVENLVKLTDGFSGSDITALAKDAAMGPLRALGEKLLYMTMDEIRPIQFEDFQASLDLIRPSVSKQGLRQFEEWAKEFGERGG